MGKTGMKIKVPRRALSEEEVQARRQAHAEIDAQFADQAPRTRKKPSWMRADFEVLSEGGVGTSGQEDSEWETGYAHGGPMDLTQSEMETEAEDVPEPPAPPPLIEVLETLLHVAEQGRADCDTTMRALATLVLQINPPLEEILSAVTSVEARLVGGESPHTLATQGAWLSLLVEGCDPSRGVRRQAEIEAEIRRSFPGHELVIFTGKGSFLDQAKAFQRAAMVLAPHGGATSHIIFCRPYTALVEYIAQERKTRSCMRATRVSSP